MKIKLVNFGVILFLSILFSCKKEDDNKFNYSGFIKSLTLKIDDSTSPPIEYKFYYENELLSKIVLENDFPNLTTTFFYYDKNGFLVNRLVKKESLLYDNPPFLKIEYFYSYNYNNSHISQEIMDSTIYYKSNNEKIVYVNLREGIVNDYTEFQYYNNRINTITYNSNKTYINIPKVELIYDDIGNIINLKRYINGEYFEQIEYSLYDDSPNPLSELKDKNGFPLLDCDYYRFLTASTFNKNNFKQLNISEIKISKDTSMTYLYQYNSNNYPQNIYYNQREWIIEYY